MDIRIAVDITHSHIPPLRPSRALLATTDVPAWAGNLTTCFPLLLDFSSFARAVLDKRHLYFAHNIIKQMIVTEREI